MTEAVCCLVLLMMGSELLRCTVQASGWDTAFQKERLLQEAYSSIFLRPLPTSPQTVT